MAQADAHLEIEHKFVLPDDFDRLVSFIDIAMMKIIKI